MQVPERLALIGGSILLSSTLIFTLKSQASMIIPNVSKNVDSIYQDLTDTQAQHGALSFDEGYQRAQKKGWTTGQWGSSKYYVDDQMDLHVGKGSLDTKLYNALGDKLTHSIQSINFDEPVQAPQDSSWLLAASSGMGDDNHTLQEINGTHNIDTSRVEHMGSMFSNDMSVRDLDLSNWDTSQVVDMNSIFDADQSLQDLNVFHWDVSKVQNFSWAFYLTSLHDLDLSSWHTDNANDMDSMFMNDSSLQRLDLSNFTTSQVNTLGMYTHDDRLSQVILGDQAPNTTLADTGLVGGTWKNGDQALSSHDFQDNHSHPGTWTRR